MSNAERDAKLLGYAGVIPLAAGALVAWLGPTLVPTYFAAHALEWTLVYGAVILSFMGGARWALAMLSGGATGTPLSGLLTAVTPALVGWVAAVPGQLVPLPVPDWLRFVLLGVGFVGLLTEDRVGVGRGEAPGWYGRLRLRLTVLVLIALTAIVVRLALA